MPEAELIHPIPTMSFSCNGETHGDARSDGCRVCPLCGVQLRFDDEWPIVSAAEIAEQERRSRMSATRRGERAASD